MIKDVHINNPKRSLLRGSNSDTDSAHSRRAPRLRGVLEAVAAGKVREIALSPKLAIASFIIHNPTKRTVERKMQMRSNSANSAIVSRQSSQSNRMPALPTPITTQPQRMEQHLYASRKRGP